MRYQTSHSCFAMMNGYLFVSSIQFSVLSSSYQLDLISMESLLPASEVACLGGTVDETITNNRDSSD